MTTPILSVKGVACETIVSLAVNFTDVIIGCLCSKEWGCQPHNRPHYSPPLVSLVTLAWRYGLAIPGPIPSSHSKKPGNGPIDSIHEVWPRLREARVAVCIWCSCVWNVGIEFLPSVVKDKRSCLSQMTCLLYAASWSCVVLWSVWKWSISQFSSKYPGYDLRVLHYSVYRIYRHSN